MQHIPEFSLVIKPPPSIVESIAILKQFLKNEIGWFGSANALAHITIFNFDADETELEIWKNKIEAFCEKLVSTEIAFDGFGSFPPRTFYIAPDNESTQYLNNLIANFHHYIDVKTKSNAHMSIARSLDAAKLEKTKMLFENKKIDFKFTCDRFVLRKFNPQDKQYSNIIAAFKFGNK